VITHTYKLPAVLFLAFSLGFGAGGYLFARTLPRSFLPIGECSSHCYTSSEIAGLLASVLILRTPFMVPGVIGESDTCLAVRHPRPEARVHYVLFPKHDITNIMTLTSEDTPYVLGCFALARRLVAGDKLVAYRLRTNGPEFQDIGYLHFHLIAQ
jgi:hypothetical protein